MNSAKESEEESYLSKGQKKNPSQLELRVGRSMLLKSMSQKKIPMNSAKEIGEESYPVRIESRKINAVLSKN